MTDKEINTALEELLKGLLLELLDHRAIMDPCQVAISAYFPQADYGKYLFFSPDVFPILYYLHPIVNDYHIEEAIQNGLEKDRKTLVRHLAELSLNDQSFRIKRQSAYNAESLRQSYGILRNISFEKPFMGDFFRASLQAKYSQWDDTLSLIYIANRDRVRTRDWETGCDIERALFMAWFYTYYACTFFNFKGLPYKKVFCVSIFCRPEDPAKINKCVLDYLRRLDSVEPLEEIVHKYLPDPPVNSSQPSVSDPIKEEPGLTMIITDLSTLRGKENKLYKRGHGMPYSERLIAELDKLIRILEGRRNNNQPPGDKDQKKLRDYIKMLRDGDAGKGDGPQTLKEIIESLNQSA